MIQHRQFSGVEIAATSQGFPVVRPLKYNPETRQSLHDVMEDLLGQSKLRVVLDLTRLKPGEQVDAAQLTWSDLYGRGMQAAYFGMGEEERRRLALGSLKGAFGRDMEEAAQLLEGRVGQDFPLYEVR